MRTARPAMLGQQCSPKRIVRESPLHETTRYRKGDTGDIIETIMAMDADSGRWIDPHAVECLRGQSLRDTLRNVWAFVKRNNTYRPDRPGHERVKSPGALFTSRTGDCKSFSIAEGALLRALGIRYQYRFAAYGAGADYTHVYVMVSTPNGWVPLDAVLDEPFQEEPYWRKLDRTPQKPAVAGIGKAPNAATGLNPAYVGLAALIILLLAR